MNLEFNIAGVTQEVECSISPEGKYYILESGLGDGYKKSLEMDYLKGIREYIRGQKNITHQTGRRILFLAPDAGIVRQAYFVLRKALLEEGKKDEPDADYEAFYKQTFSYLPPAAEIGKVWVVPEKKNTGQRPSEKDSEVVFHFVPFMGGPFMEKEDRDVKGGIEKENNVLVELGDVKEGDEAVNYVLQLENPWIAVYLKPSGSYEYALKRLVFEGGYQVISLGNLSKQDYLNYAEQYLEFHHFSAAPEDLKQMIEGLFGYRGAQMTEKDIYLHLNRCMKSAFQEKKRILGAEELAVAYDTGKLSARQEFERTVGLDSVKNILLRRLAAKQIMQEQNGAARLHCNYILEGPPGTGKSKMARILARMMGEMGISNGKFVDVSRSDIIGKFVGHTAAKVREVFEQADGGVIFVDEASFLLGSDQYVQEAVIEFVRFMELYPQTMVLFATYPKEGKKLLLCDSGFRSRIHQILTFTEYTNPEMYRIFQVMAEDYGFGTEPECEKEFLNYIEKIRGKKNFGNAREVRRLLETAIEEFGLRNGTKESRNLAAEDVFQAAKYLLAAEGEEAPYGFFLPQEAETEGIK